MDGVQLVSAPAAVHQRKKWACSLCKVRKNRPFLFFVNKISRRIFMKIETPYRAERTYVQKYPGHAPQAVFPLLCPVREAEWLPDWDPQVVYTRSGVAEPGCTFLTLQDGRQSIWQIIHHDPENLEVKMVKITPDVTACLLQIVVRPDGKQGSEAQVTYSHTAIGPEGKKLVDEFTEAFYQQIMTRWENFLSTHLEKENLSNIDLV